MTTPRVTEIVLPLAPVERDPFIDAPSRSSVARRRDRELHGRRVESVCEMLRPRAHRNP
jgi:hypothetical protein